MNESNEDFVNVDLTNASKVDWSACSFPIGVEVPGQDPPWLGLDEDDLKILHGLLAMKVGIGGESAMDSSPALQKMALWAKAASEWCEAKRKGREQ